MLVDDDVLLFKFYLNITQKTQKNRIKDRETDPLKSWKLSKLDYLSMEKYDSYEILRDKMFLHSGTSKATWCKLEADDKKRARLNAVRYLLTHVPYEGKDESLICGVDKKIVTHYNQKDKNE